MQLDWTRPLAELGQEITDEGLDVLDDQRKVFRILAEAHNCADFFKGRPVPWAQQKPLELNVPWTKDEPAQLGWILANALRAVSIATKPTRS